ncbi:hypothetical protein HJC23_012215 [Cyclotella cryptica]|uniref:L domain-like protein n=1 Tax=Cyclotella cryptica TaxID=29204 RepID=A0ABD3PZT3_9STRA
MFRESSTLIAFSNSLHEISTVTFSYLPATELVETYLQDPNGLVEFRNIIASNHSCFALFGNGHSAGTNKVTGGYLIPDSGVILSSGNPEHFNGQNSDSTTTDFGVNTGDQDLENAIPGAEVFDPCYIQFEFRCPPSSEIFTPEVNFDYVFGSDEYIEYVFSQYNDAFGFFLNGENIALVPGTTTPVSINNVNAEVNSQYYVDNVLTGRGSRTSPYPLIEADGFTTKMTAIAEPEPEWNLIKMVTGDVSDGILDSWVLLEAGTFSCVKRTEDPSASPSGFPSESPSPAPTMPPSDHPTTSPSGNPTELLSSSPTDSPSTSPMATPTESPSEAITAKPTPQPTVSTDSPSVSSAPSYSYPCGLLPCEREKDLRDFYSSISEPALFENPSTPQSLALDWITNHDSMMVCPNDPKTCHTIQRYVMAVMYFSLKGHQWTECSAPKDFNCEDEIKLADQTCNIIPSPHYPNQTRVGGFDAMAWLSPSHECLWGGCVCHGDDVPELSYCLDQLEFEGNNLKGLIPNEIARLEHLRFLSFEKGNLTGTIPSALGSIHGLHTIDLDFNELTGPIPDAIYGLKNLRQLDLNNNALTGTLSSKVGMLGHLQVLQVDHNLLTGTIPSEIRDLENLEVGFFSYNNFTGHVDEGICALRSPAGHLDMLQVDCAVDGGKVACDCCSSCRQPDQSNVLKMAFD